VDDSPGDEAHQILSFIGKVAGNRLFNEPGAINGNARRNLNGSFISNFSVLPGPGISLKHRMTDNLSVHPQLEIFSIPVGHKTSGKLPDII
jgi:hypothetical protein